MDINLASIAGNLPNDRRRHTGGERENAAPRGRRFGRIAAALSSVLALVAL